MTPEKWQDIVGKVKDNFTVAEHNKSHLDEEGGIDIEYIIFTGPLGRIKLEYLVKPVVLDKKTLYSRRIGAETKVEYVYSQEEKNYKLKVYKWDEGRDDWLEMAAGKFDL